MAEQTELQTSGNKSKSICKCLHLSLFLWLGQLLNAHVKHGTSQRWWLTFTLQLSPTTSSVKVADQLIAFTKEEQRAVIRVLWPEGVQDVEILSAQ
jgi:hypothetical protein